MNDEDKARGNFRKPRKSSGAGNTADWEACDPNTLVKLIATASKKGGALRFGYTRDGGAYAIGVYAGGDYFTDYVRPSEDIDSYLTDLLSSFDDYEPDEKDPPRRVKKAR